MSTRLLLGLLLVLAASVACTGPGGQSSTGEPATRFVGSTSSTIAVTPDGRTVWVVNPDADTVTGIDALSLQPGSPVPVGREPWGVAVTPNGTVLVLNRLDGSVSILAGGSRTDVPVGAEPGGLAVASDGLHAWVSVSGTDELVLLDLTTATVRERHRVAPDPWALAVLPGVDVAGGDTVLITHRLARGRTGNLDLPENERREGRLTIFHVSGSQVLTLPPHDFGFPNILESVALVGDTAYVAHLLNSPAVPNDFQTSIAGGLSAVDLQRPGEMPARRLNLNDPEFSTPTNFPRALAAHPGRPLLFLALAGSDSVMGIDVSVPEAPRLVGFWPTGRNPRGIAISPDGNQAFVMSYLSRTVSVLDLSDPGNLSTHVEVASVPVTPETVADKLLRGQILFNNASDPRLSRTGWMSCASCHPDGRADGTTWNLGEGPRQTMPLWNLAGTAPFHAAGTRDEVQDFESDIELLMGGIGLAPGPANPLLGNPNGGTSTDLDALAAFVLNGIRAPVAAPATAATLARGRQVFEAQGCSGCHFGPSWTGSSQAGEPGGLDPEGTGVVTDLMHDVGTFDATADLTGVHGFGVPTLLGLKFSAPYFHDGRAGTLEGVLDHPAHSGPATTGQNRADLIAFLLSIDASTQPFRSP